MFSNRFNTYVFLAIMLIFSLASCRKKDKIDTDPSLTLAFSEDTIFFDTVFSTIGSVTKRLVVYNNNEHKVSISQISLSGGEQSNYRLNIDGLPTLAIRDVEVPGKDSLFIFIRVTVDPTNQNTPFIVNDSILFAINTNLQDVQLVSWGQNARFLKAANLRGNQVWDSLQPFVIYQHVRVDTNATLTIMPGTKIYFHKNAFLAVSCNASLQVVGTLNHPVRFQGDRLDPYYKDLPGQWDGIYLDRGSLGHEITYAIIKNGIFGLVVDSVGSSSDPVLTLDNTIIQNTTADALFAYATNILSVNCVLTNCGGSSLAIVKGGTYDFRQLTIGNFWSGSVRFSPALYISNYTYDQDGNKIINPVTNIFFGNSIIYGSDTDEFFPDTMPGTSPVFRFDHCLIKTEQDLSNPNHYIACIRNEDPLFVNPQEFDFHIDSLSPAIDQGIQMNVLFDIEGVSRGVTPDLGAYEWIPTR